jgi:spore germination cell wall hydrolase CwlJ-like protein
MRWVQALAALMMVVHTHPAVGADLRRGELEIMVRIVQAEATGEPALGAKSVAWTMLNRLRAGTYGRTLTRVMLAPHQYASPAPLDDSSDAYLKAMHATVSALLGVGGDPTGGSTHFARCDLRPQPLWMRTFERRAVHGAHCFFRKRR